MKMSVFFNMKLLKIRDRKYQVIYVLKDKSALTKHAISVKPTIKIQRIFIVDSKKDVIDDFVVSSIQSPGGLF